MHGCERGWGPRKPAVSWLVPLPDEIETQAWCVRSGEGLRWQWEGRGTKGRKNHEQGFEDFEFAKSRR